MHGLLQLQVRLQGLLQLQVQPQGLLQLLQLLQPQGSQGLLQLLQLLVLFFRSTPLVRCQWYSGNVIVIILFMPPPVMWGFLAPD